MSTADDDPRRDAADASPRPVGADAPDSPEAPRAIDAPDTPSADDAPDAPPAGDKPDEPRAIDGPDTPSADVGPDAPEHGLGDSPDTVDRAAAPYPWLAWLARNRWQALAALWIVLTIFSLARDGGGFRTWFAVIMTVLFTAAAVLELRGRRRLAARRADADPDGRAVG